MDGIRTLVRQQVELARIEAGEAVAVRAKGAGMMGAAGVVGLFALRPSPFALRPSPFALRLEAYLKGLNPEPRAALQKLREAIASELPEAEEAIVHSMPGGRPLPVRLVRKVLETRLAEVEARRR